MGDPVADFKVVLMEGLFYDRGGDLFVEQDEGVHRAVVATLLPLVGERVQFALHHLPPNGLQPGQPGAGSCQYPGGKGCPLGHDVRPNRLLSFHLEGVLKADPWRLEKFDGTESFIPFSGLDGHYGRVACATLLDVEAIRDLVSQAPSVQGLGAQDIEAALARLKKGLMH